MKATISVSFLLLALCLAWEAQASQVVVQDANFDFSLKSVKILQDLIDSVRLNHEQNPRLASTSYTSVCSHPSLPQEFLPLCMQRGASMIISRLAAVPMDICEICAFAACTGC
ncbi:hypothetical protein DPEC_G00206980 [Dallia pectoralis]|uniref:Uncharacterized protein n=1 Tax=Dallia pectoralis TaxID=75939 RepID=A0ACC2G539_DALPE|nr:hypothetical protein DPEC_G00206980 [Dallia pectoralis]